MKNLHTVFVVFAAFLLIEVDFANGFHWQDGDLGVKWQSNCDFPGNPGHVSDFTSIPNSRGEDCGQYCVSYTNQCNAFSYFHGTCYLKLRRSTGGTPIPQPAQGGVCGYLPDREISR